MKTRDLFCTDYPILKLGDVPHELAPMRDVKILDYDGDKYCKVEVIPTFFDKKPKAKIIEFIKSGYIYKRVLHKHLAKYEKDCNLVEYLENEISRVKNIVVGPYCAHLSQVLISQKIILLDEILEKTKTLKSKMGSKK
jgi:hypothetical protein